jgi:hypothetical protein
MNTSATVTAHNPTSPDPTGTGPTCTGSARQHEVGSSAQAPTSTTGTRPAGTSEPERAVAHRIPVKALAVLAGAAVVFGLAHVFTGLFMALVVLTALGAIVGIAVLAVLAGLPWLLAALVVIVLLAGIASVPTWLFAALAVITLTAVAVRTRRRGHAHA